MAFMNEVKPVMRDIADQVKSACVAAYEIVKHLGEEQKCSPKLDGLRI